MRVKRSYFNIEFIRFRTRLCGEGFFSECNINLEYPSKSTPILPIQVSKMTMQSIEAKIYPTRPITTENRGGLVHQIRALIYGECPECHSTHSKQIKGWAKRQCDDCGCTWNY